MYRLDIKVDKIIKNTFSERRAIPVTMTWQWKQIALSNSKDDLEKYKDSLPETWFYERDKRNYQIYE